jgi:hypothetical protein
LAKFKYISHQFHFTIFRDLPQENWNDLAEFVPRRQLGQIVPQIGDRHFAWIIQSFLHEFGQITLGKFQIVFPIDGNAPGIKSNGNIGWPLAAVQMPSNIANFNEIHLWFVFFSKICLISSFVQLFRRVRSRLPSAISAQFPAVQCESEI